VAAYEVGGCAEPVAVLLTIPGKSVTFVVCNLINILGSMKMTRQSILSIVILILCLGSICFAAPSSGTDQMPGVWGEFGKEYTIGGDSPMNFALKSAEFTVSQVKMGEELFFPTASEKFLVLHFTAHNPQKTEHKTAWSTFKFTAVDANSQSWEYANKIALEKDSGLFSVGLKPAQKVDAYTFIRMPADAIIPKLIVYRGEKNPVVRFDMKEKIKPLAEPYADPADKTGSIALTEVPSQLDTYYPLGFFDMKVIGASYTDQPVIKEKPAAGYRFMVVTVTIKNMNPKDRSVARSTFIPKLVASDGEELKWKQELVHATRPEALPGTVIKPNKELTARYFFAVRTDTPAKTLTIQEGLKGRVYAFDVSGVN